MASSLHQQMLERGAFVVGANPESKLKDHQEAIERLKEMIRQDMVAHEAKRVDPGTRKIQFSL